MCGICGIYNYKNCESVQPQVVSAMKSWSREYLLVLAKDYLTDTRIKKEGIFDIDVIERIIQRHISGVQDNSTILLTLLCWKCWYDRFAKKQGL